MQTRRTRTQKYVLGFSLLFCLSLLSGCLESSFQLSPTSRLPVWFKLPAEMARSDVSVTLNYYSNPSGANAKLILKDKSGNVLETVRGNDVNLTEPGVYPGYVRLTANGVSEVLEHQRMEPIFFVSDDPKLRNQAVH